MVFSFTAVFGAPKPWFISWSWISLAALTKMSDKPAKEKKKKKKKKKEKKKSHMNKMFDTKIPILVDFYATV